MSLLTNITGSGFPTSGAASAGTTGLAAVTNLTHVGSAGVPPGSAANGYMTSTAAVTTSFRIDATTVPFAVGNRYSVRFWIRCRVTDATLLADGTSLTRLVQVNDGTTRWYTQMTTRETTKDRGFTILVSNTVGGTNQHMESYGASGGPGIIPMDTWVEVVISELSDAAAGDFEVHINGCLIERIINLPSLTYITTMKTLLVSLGVVTGATWDVCAPFESWDEVTTDITVQPRFSDEPASSHLKQAYLMRWIDGSASGAIPRGAAWVMTAGTATVTPTSVGSSGLYPRRYYAAISGAAASTATLKTVKAVGTLPYATDGWASFFFPNLYFPGNVTASIRIRDSGDTTDIIKLDVDTVAATLKQGATTLGVWTAAKRYAIQIMLNSDGRAQVALIWVDGVNNALRGVSAALTAWTPQAVGKIQYDIVIGASTCHLDIATVQKTVNYIGVDSYTHGTTGASPEYSAPAHNAAELPGYNEGKLIPNGCWNHRHNGLERCCVFPLGSAGKTLQQFADNVMPMFTGIYGTRMILVGFSSVNDTAGVASDASRNIQSAIYQTNLAAVINGMLANGNSIWMGNGVPNVQGATYNNFQRNLEADMNQIKSDLSHLLQRNNLIQYSEVNGNIGLASSVYSGVDDTHPDAAGDATEGYQLVVRRTTPSRYSLGSSSGGGSSFVRAGIIF